MKKSTIAIVIPVFNVENYVRQTLESVKNQLSQPDEVIIINDGSTDSSSKIIDDIQTFSLGDLESDVANRKLPKLNNGSIEFPCLF